MPIQLTVEALRKIWPQAPQPVIDAFVAKQAVLEKAGINHTRTRLSYALAQVEHETNGFTIRNLTENINYTAERAAQIWPNRFPGGASQVRNKYGTGTGWQLRMFDDVYGNRMGNRPGTRDGSTFIGRGGPQVTGRDGYTNVGNRAGLALTETPTMCGQFDLQPEILAAFWTWKNMNPKADLGDFRGLTKLWNGGTVGMADREARLAGNDPIIARLQKVDIIKPVVHNEMPGQPPTPQPPKEVIDAVTTKERAARAGGIVIAGAGAGTETVTRATKKETTVPSPPIAKVPSYAAYAGIGIGVAVVVVVAYLIVRKKQRVQAHWV